MQGHPGSIRLIAKLTSMHGPSVFSLLSVSKKGATDEVQHAQDLGDMLQFFRNDIVPWCLAGDEYLNGPKAELVLAFIENADFQGEWEFVIGQLTECQESMDSVVDLRQVEVLATLLEKVTEKKKAVSMNSDDLLTGNDWWKSPRIDRAAVKVASSKHLSHPGCSCLLRYSCQSNLNVSAVLLLDLPSNRMILGR